MVSYQSTLSFDPALYFQEFILKIDSDLCAKFYTYRHTHYITVYVSKTVNILNAHPNKEILVFLSTHTHTHIPENTQEIYYCLFPGSEANQLRSNVERKLAFYHMIFLSFEFHTLLMTLVFFHSFTNCYIFPPLCQYSNSYVCHDV